MKEHKDQPYFGPFEFDPPKPSIPLGLCQCGCGQPTPLATRTDRSRGDVKGQPRRWATRSCGHRAGGRIRPTRNTPAYATEDRGYATPCWIWQRYIHPDGYGQYRINDKVDRAHRRAYELAFGPIPDGLQIDHLCRVRACINPDHLEAVTQRVNLRRGIHVILTPSSVRAIRALPSAAEVRAQASQFGVTEKTAELVWYGRSWKDIEPRAAI